MIWPAFNANSVSDRIERATYRDLGTRFPCADPHPDHDAICKICRDNLEVIAEAFEQVLLMARELKLLRVSIVSVDGTRMDANARKHRSVRDDRPKALRQQLQVDITELLDKAEAEDLSQDDAHALPAELERREALTAVVDVAGSEQVLGARVTQSSSDANELAADIDAVPASLAPTGLALADRGYVNGREVSALKRRGIEVLMATGAEPTRRRYDSRGR